MNQTTLLKPESRLFSPPDSAALAGALANAPAALREAAKAAELIDKEGRALGGLLDEMAAAGGAPLVVLPLGAEEKLFANALLAHCAGWAAAGAQLACAAVPGCELMVYAGDEADAAPLRGALAETACGLTFLTGPSSPVLREESALYAAMAGEPIRSELMEKAFPLQGFEGRPTLVLDIETACWLAAAVLLPGLPQGKLVAGQALTMADGAPGEAAPPVLGHFPLGAPLGEIAQAMALCTAHPVLLGGACGRLADASTPDAAAEYDHDYDTIRSYDEKCCMADVGRALAERAAALSCGKCVLCREGSWQLKAIFGDIVAGRGKRTDLALVADIAPLISLGAFCDFGRRMVRPAAGIASLCRPELEAHIVRKSCPAGVCQSFASYVIDPRLCTGCGECIDACAFDAIEGKDGYIHMIDEDYCEKCGKCASACEEGAARLATGKIKLPKKLTKVGAFK